MFQQDQWFSCPIVSEKVKILWPIYPLILISPSFFFRQIDYVPFTRTNSCEGTVDMSYRYLVQDTAILCKLMSSTPGNLRVMYSEASVLGTLILNGHSEEYKFHSCLLNKKCHSLRLVKYCNSLTLSFVSRHWDTPYNLINSLRL